MNQLEIFEESISVLRTNKMRTGLSILGIVIGIGSVIALMTMGQASQKSVEDRIQSLGSNLLSVTPNNNGTLYIEDYEELESSELVTKVDQVAAEYMSQITVAYESNSVNTSVVGISNNYFEVRNVEIEYGNELTQTDQDLLNKVAVIGPDTASELYGDSQSALNQPIKLNGVKFTVIGVTKEKGQLGRTNFDAVIYIPLATAQKALFGNNDLTTIYITAYDEIQMEAAENQVGNLLLQQHRIDNPADADFSISSQADLLETVSEVTGTFTMLLTGIAAISLVVGGIGIMNIMLVTVTERTREIGVRKALGAKRKIIVNQFLMESIILTFTGGLVGVGVGVIASFVITHYMDLPQMVSTSSIVLAFAVSGVIGIVFGWYPAQKASKLQPIEALRYE
jgi:putative ABC transport system permease protein